MRNDLCCTIGKRSKDKGDKSREREHSLLPVRTKKINDDAHDDARNAALRRTHSECVGQFL